jgi:hypothetical protein
MVPLRSKSKVVIWVLSSPKYAYHLPSTFQETTQITKRWWEKNKITALDWNGRYKYCSFFILFFYLLIVIYFFEKKGILQFLNVRHYRLPQEAQNIADKKEEMLESTRTFLRAFYAQHNKKLYELLNRKFKWDVTT